MSLRKGFFALLAMFGFPAVTFAGPIEFRYSVSNFETFQETRPEASMVLVPNTLQAPSAIYTFDSALNVPVNLAAVGYVPSNLPTPDPIHIHPNGTTHWNFESYFRVDVTITDVASGESATVELGGRAHIYNHYSVVNGWTGETFFWFKDARQFTLGDNDYTIWGNNDYSNDPATVNVWVGPNPPVHLSPEPGTLALAALGVVPLGLRRLRRMW